MFFSMGVANSLNLYYMYRILLMKSLTRAMPSQGNHVMQRVFPMPNDSDYLLQLTKGQGHYSKSAGSYLSTKSRLNVKLEISK